MSASQGRVGATCKVAIHGGAQRETQDGMNKSGLPKEAAWCWNDSAKVKARLRRALTWGLRGCARSAEPPDNIKSW